MFSRDLVLVGNDLKVLIRHLPTVFFGLPRADYGRPAVLPPSSLSIARLTEYYLLAAIARPVSTVSQTGVRTPATQKYPPLTAPNNSTL